MIYKTYGKTGRNVSALGFGSIRFLAEDLKDEDGLYRCAELVRKASALGVNFFDVAPIYANGFGERIYGIAFKNMPNPFFISNKSIITTDKTADDVRRRIEQQLEIMGVEQITFYHMWSIMNREHYQRVMAKGGPYEGALRAKDEGLIGHVCFSTHANATENMEMIQNGVFEGMIISFNALNYSTMLPVIKAAADREMGVAAMNPLGGGIITKQTVGGHFDYLMQPCDETIAAAALRFVASFPEMTTVISGMKYECEIIQNVDALSNDPIHNRIEQVSSRFIEQNGQLCTGCGYCSNCPENIPVADYMQAYNMRLFPALPYMGLTLAFSDESQIKAYNIFKTLRQNSGIIPENIENPCVKCGQCEEKCTQRLPIMSFMDDISYMAAKFGYNKTQICQRIADEFSEIPSGRFGIYPTGVFTDALRLFLKENFPNLKVKLFDKNPALWGKESSDLIIMSPQEIPEQVDVLLITHHLYGDAIYQELCPLEKKGVRVVKLYKKGDIPYFY